MSLGDVHALTVNALVRTHVYQTFVNRDALQTAVQPPLALAKPEEVGQLSREFLDQSNHAIFYASWLKFLSSKFTQGGKNL